MKYAPSKLVRSILVPALAASLTGCRVDIDDAGDLDGLDELDLAAEEVALIEAPAAAAGILRAERPVAELWSSKTRRWPRARA